jgi:hypothetical protein
VELVRAGLGGFGACQGGSGADQRGLGALARGVCTGDRPALNRARILELWLVGGWQLEHLLRFVECHLSDVSSFLGMVECLLADVPRDLLAIDSSLAISKNPLLALGPAAALTLVILGNLLLIDERLLPVADELRSFTEGLLKIGEALLAAELSLA